MVVFAKSDKVRLIFPCIFFSNILVNLLIWLCHQYICFFKKFSEHGHSFCKVRYLLYCAIKCGVLFLPFICLVLFFQHSSWKRKIVCETDICISFQHEDLVIQMIISWKRSHHNYWGWEWNKFRRELTCVHN